MKTFIGLFIFIGAASFLFGCRSHKDVAPVVEHIVEYKDSVRTEYVERTVFVPDTVFLEIPLQVTERETRDSISTLENDYAWSVARVTTDGLLFHSLYTKPQLRPVAFDKPVTTITSNESHFADKSEINNETKVEYVEKDLSWWQETQIYGFWVVLLLMAVIHRKAIFNFGVRLFTKK